MTPLHWHCSSRVTPPPPLLLPWQPRLPPALSSLPIILAFSQQRVPLLRCKRGKAYEACLCWLSFLQRTLSLHSKCLHDPTLHADLVEFYFFILVGTYEISFDFLPYFCTFYDNIVKTHQRPQIMR